jgi:hypothetical protein
MVTHLCDGLSDFCVRRARVLHQPLIRQRLSAEAAGSMAARQPRALARAEQIEPKTSRNPHQSGIAK